MATGGGWMLSSVAAGPAMIIFAGSALPPAINAEPLEGLLVERL